MTSRPAEIVRELRRAVGYRGSERGSATIWVLALAAMMMALTMAVVLRSTAVLARHRMERAADLSALAAADRIGGTGDPCAAAVRIAGENGARLVECSLELDASGRSGTVAIVLNKSIGLPVIGVRTVTGRARAGRLPPPNSTHPP
ncbi:MAG: flp pilus-assembly TadE/G-like family protein [Actinomycetota bacterium]|nr:flp pilus-assembly TadE/G-like family protein [Actinomycetota bacterium]MDQ2958113.1 flp pilus-assembly TadE/G-like family protein [Actinomycetota bacterium]